MVFAGPVAKGDLPALYSGATLFVFPSLYEGFGLPVLEAMACGVPVVCSNTSSLPEVAGDAALLADPLDVDALAATMSQALTGEDLRQEMRQKGMVQVAKFSWEQTARETLAVYKQVIGEKPMNILHIYKDYPPILGGIENHLKVLAEGQAARGHAVTVLVTNPAGAQTTVTTENGVRVVRAGRLATVASTPLSIALPRWLMRERPDVTHLHFPYPFGDVAHALFGRARRTVITYHSDIVRQKSLLRLYAPFCAALWRGPTALSPPALNTWPPRRFLRPTSINARSSPTALTLPALRPPTRPRWRRFARVTAGR